MAIELELATTEELFAEFRRRFTVGCIIVTRDSNGNVDNDTMDRVAEWWGPLPYCIGLARTLSNNLERIDDWGDEWRSDDD